MTRDEHGLLVGILGGLAMCLPSCGATDHHDSANSVSSDRPALVEKDQAARVPAELSIPMGDGGAMELVLIPAGDFMMGADPDDPQLDGDEVPRHRVRIDRPFYMGKYEVTQAQVAAVLKDRSVDEGDADLPAKLSWYEAKAFCESLSRATGRRVRLPSEAEWEYACRAGTATPYYFGATLTTVQANIYDGPPKRDLHWTAGRGPRPVGSYLPNKWGLHDMHGNIYEWCEDLYSFGYEGAPTDGSAWMRGWSSLRGQLEGARVLRGGDWGSKALFARCADRGLAGPGSTGLYGFRVVVETTADQYE